METLDKMDVSGKVAIARPIPLEAPVTMATLPDTSILFNVSMSTLLLLFPDL